MTPRGLARTLGRAVLLTASLAATTLAFEAWLRAFAPQPLVVPVNEEFLGLAAPSAGMRGRIELPGEYDTTVRINSEHFRMNRPVAVEPETDVERIALLGDSVTFGVGADDDQTYPSRLETLLAASRGARHVEVINGGVIATGTGEQAVWYERWVSRFHPKMVVLNVFFNDVDDDRERQLIVRAPDGHLAERLVTPARVTWLSRMRRLPGSAYLASHSHVAALVRVAGAKLAGRSVATTDPLRRAYDRASFTGEGLPLQAAEIVYLRDRVAANAARLIVVSIPAREILYPAAGAEPSARWKSEAIAQSLRTVCERSGIPFLDLAADLRARSARSVTPLYFARDSHPTPAGYQAIAEIVERFLALQL